jgi:hypothetical protein
MKTKISIFLAVTTMLFSCNKIDPIQTKAENDDPVMTTRSVTAGEKVAEKVNGIVICTIDEDILKSSVMNYYGASSVKSFGLEEYNKNQSDNFYVLEGKLKAGSHTIQYAFELVPLALTNGDIEFYLPIAGTEQNVNSAKGSSGKLKLTSASTGYMNPGHSGSVYSTSTSTTNTDTDGTVGLIKEIALILFP